MQKRAYAGIIEADRMQCGPTEVMLVEAGKVRSVKERAVKLRENAMTYIFGTMIKQILEDLDLWEDGTR